MKPFKLPKTDIEYLDYCWNFQSGCSYEACPCRKECWAKGMAVHYRNGDFEPTFHPHKLYDVVFPKEPSRIGVCFTGDIWDFYQTAGGGSITLFHETMKKHPEHKFFLLTKRPSCYKYDYPDNCYVGITATGQKDLDERMKGFGSVRAQQKWLSLEPLLEPVERILCQFDLIVLGGLRGKPKHTREWVDTITEIARNQNQQLYYKDNLGKDYPKGWAW